MRTTALDRPADNTASQLFTVRLWPHDLGDGRIEWRGKVQHMLSGETRYFREWQGLIIHIRALLAAQQPEPPRDQLTEHD